MNTATLVSLLLCIALAVRWHASAKIPIGLGFATILVVVAQSVLIEQAILGIPVRVLAFVAASLILGWKLAATRSGIGFGRSARVTLWLWAFYMTSATVALVLNDTIVGSAGLLDVVSRYGYALVAFAIVYSVARREGGAFALCGLLFGLAFLNILFAGAQVLEISWARVVHEMLFPWTGQRADELIELGLITTYGYAPGLSAYSISTGFVISCYGGLALAFASRRQNRFDEKEVILYLTLAVGSVLLGGVLVLSRSTIGAGALLLLVFIYGLNRRGTSQANWIRARRYVSVLVGLVILGAPYALGQFENLDRLWVISDIRRANLIDDAARFIMANPFLGGYRSAIASQSISVAAHNFFANSLLYFGLIGALPAWLFAVWVVRISWVTIRGRIDATDNLVPLSCAGGIISYLFKSMFHNESIVTSGITLMILMGILLGARDMSRRNHNGPCPLGN